MAGAPRDATRRPGVGWRWILLATSVGFAASALLTRGFHFERRAFVAAWAPVVLVVWLAYARSNGVSLRTQLSRRWAAGLVIGAAIGAVLALTVARQPASTIPTGLRLVAEGFWLGIVYGVADALMLSVLPVVALYGAQPADALRTTSDRLRWGGVALAGSAVVTAAYHAGFREFQGPELMQPVLGNLVITLGFLLSGSPAAPLLSHVMMHVAAVLNGAATTVQLPPHY
jgi:hypothetical protein